MKLLPTLSVAFVLAMTTSVAVAQSGGMKGMDMNAVQKGTHQASGTVRKIDAEAGRLTIAHGPVPSLNWPSMNMVFKVKDNALLGKVKPGDKIEFSFVQSGKDYLVTEIR
jgi:Cu(I)/Ag(I) efflux system protein CusF